MLEAQLVHTISVKRCHILSQQGETSRDAYLKRPPFGHLLSKVVSWNIWKRLISVTAVIFHRDGRAL